MYDVFRNDGREVYTHWIKYIQKIDTRIEDAARATVKKSLLEISKAINGEGKNHPLFKVNVILEVQKVDFSPNFNHLEQIVNKIAREMISTINVLPRLTQLLAPVFKTDGRKLRKALLKYSILWPAKKIF
jgi:dynein heavy chain, axonemal